MGVEVGSLSRNTQEPFKTWQLERYGVDDDDATDTDIGALLFSSMMPRQCPTHPGVCYTSPSAHKHEPESGDGQLRKCLDLLATPLSTPASSASESQQRPGAQGNSLQFNKTNEKTNFDFPRQSTFLKLEKRPRADSDVDGPYTAALSCKKRRLRHRLITSRLSQPYSLPATHIISRDGVASGARRFVKLAAVATSPDPSKQGLNRERSIMLRTAVLNRVRLRVRSEATLWSDHVVAIAAVNAAVLHHGQKFVTGARFVAPSSAHAMRQSQHAPRVILMRPAINNGPEPGSMSKQAERMPSPPRMSQSTRTIPKYPKLQPTQSSGLTPSETMLNEMDDDGTLAFPMSNHGCHYAWADEDDLEEVYSDFGAIFGGSTQTGDAKNDGSYEEYLDELDGISCVGRWRPCAS